MNEDKAILITKIGVFVSFVSFFTMPIMVTGTLIFISSILGIYAVIINILRDIKQLKSKLSDKKND